MLVSSTVKDLVAGSGLRFGDRSSQSVSPVNGVYSRSNGEELDARKSTKFGQLLLDMTAPIDYDTALA